MKGSGELLLISCYELGHQPSGLAGPIGFLEQAGYTPTAIDVSIQGLEPASLSRARFVGISVPMHTALRIGLQVAGRVREQNPQCHICFFGLYSSLNAEHLLGSVADSVIGGEFEAPLVELVKTLSEGRDRPIEGVQKKGNPASPLLEHLPPVTPSRSSLPPLSSYAHLETAGERRAVGSVETSRGCRHLCRHCPIPPVYGGRFFLVGQETVLEDIRQLVRLGAAHISFGDPDFLNAPNHGLRVVRRMKKEFPEVTFDFTAKIEHILKHRSLLPEFGERGCLFVVSAVESLNDGVLARLAKNHTRADVVEAFKVARACAIALRPSLVTFSPWSGLEDVVDLFDFVEREGLIDYIDAIQFTIRLLIPPGSLLLEEPSLAPYLGPLVQESFSYQWFHPDPRVDELQRVFSREVEQATERHEDPETLFFQLKEIALAAWKERIPERIARRPRADRTRPPRLTESWFCCAEPSENQYAAVERGKKST